MRPEATAGKNRGAFRPRQAEPVGTVVRKPRLGKIAEFVHAPFAPASFKAGDGEVFYGALGQLREANAQRPLDLGQDDAEMRNCDNVAAAVPASQLFHEPADSRRDVLPSLAARRGRIAGVVPVPARLGGIPAGDFVVRKAFPLAEADFPQGLGIRQPPSFAADRVCGHAGPLEIGGNDNGIGW